MKKKLLAFLLSLALIVSLLPATFASAADASEAPANENIDLVYGIYGYKTEGNLTGGTALYDDVLVNIWNATKITDVNDYSTTGNTWKYYDSNSSKLSSSETFYWRTRLYALVGQWIAFKINVPVAGSYDVTVKANGNGEGGGTFAYTILDGDKTNAEITAAVSDVAWDETAEAATGNCLGFIDNSLYNNRVVSDTAEDINFPEAGDYILVLKTVKLGATSGDTYNNNIFYAGIELRNGDGSKGVPFGATSVKDSSLKVGEETTAFVSGKLYDSATWAEYEAVSVTYESSDISVATVDSTGEVTAVGEGEAEISAIVDGAKLVSAPINVAGENENIQIVYSNTPGTVFTSTALDETTDIFKDFSANFYGGGTTGPVVQVQTLNDYSKTGGFWKYYASNSSYLSSSKTYYGQMRLYVPLGQWIAFKFRVPVAGKYDLTVGAGCHDSAGGRWSYTVLDGDKTAAEITEAVDNVAWDASTEILSGNALGQLNSDPTEVLPDKYPSILLATTHTSKVDLEAGEHILVLKTIEEGESNTNSSENTNIFFRGFSLKNGDGTKTVPMGTTSLEASELTEGEITIPSAIAYGSNDWMTYEGETVTYKSSAPTVAAFVGDGIVAKKEGTAEITAVVDGIELASTPIKVLPKNDPAPRNPSIYVASKDEAAVSSDKITVTGGGATQPAGGVISIYQGALVKVTAPKTVGKYRFKYWLGTGKIESFEPEYSFGNFTNKALLAVYEEIPAEGQATVTFYKQNKEIVDSKVVDKGTEFGTAKPAADPTLIGYAKFMGWFLGEGVMADGSDKIEKDTEVVALFDNPETVTGITVDGNDVGDMSYDEAKTITADSEAFSYWMRGDKIVSYNKAYTFYAWQNNAAFTSVNKGAVDAEVVAVLDKRGEDYILEYEVPADCEKYEVGIIFGDDANITVGSCYAKVVSQKEDARGFLAASADDFDYAKGYVIFRDANGVTRVAYSD